MQRSNRICLPEILKMPSIDIGGSNVNFEVATSAEILKQANIANSLQKMKISYINS